MDDIGIRLYGNPNGVANIRDPTAITIGSKILLNLNLYGNPNGVLNISLRSKSKFSSLIIQNSRAITIGRKILLNLDLYGNPNGVANIHDATAITIGG